LVAPLDWGLGHATRCIPVIHGLMAGGYEVILAAEGAQASLLQTEFPSLLCLPLEGYKVKYSKDPSLLAFTLLRQLPRLIKIIRRENRWLADTIREHAIDLVISDNRYGLYTDKVPCVFITHQLLIKAPFAWVENILQRINYRYINRFTACWVPDTEGEPNAAGILSHPRKLPAIPVHYMGLLSRFMQQTAETRYDICILLSGPEPQRTVLERKILSGIDKVPGKVLLVRGRPGSVEKIMVPVNVEVQNHLPQIQLQQALLQSNYIISRSGYTTVMELLSLQKRSLLIPTPGQTEQEYLAKRLHEQDLCYTVEQSHFHFERDLALARGFSYKNIQLAVCNSGHIAELLRATLHST